MQVYNVGPDREHPGGDYDEKFVWIVIHYTKFDYEGSGEAVALGHDGMLYFKGLSHCSCYGPFDEFENGQFEKVSVEDYLKSDSIHDTDTENNKIRSKVIELLGEKKMAKFYAYRQNNSGGRFIGPALWVIVEANSSNVAMAIAEDNDVYFNGCETGQDCSCCGDRWSSWADVDDRPEIYGKSVEEALKSDPYPCREEFQDKPIAIVIYLNGTILKYDRHGNLM